jgi:hypothetical protein
MISKKFTTSGFLESGPVTIKDELTARRTEFYVSHINPYRQFERIRTGRIWPWWKAHATVQKFSTHTPPDSSKFPTAFYRVFSIDYRCDIRRFLLSAHNCQAPTPTFQNLELEQQIRIFEADWHQLLGRLKSTIPNLQTIYQKRRILRSRGWELTIQAGWLFWVCGWTCAWRWLMTGIFEIFESSATQWYQEIAGFFFFSS